MNESNTAYELYVSDPLTEITRKVRRSLLGVSVLSIAVVKAGLLPCRITALGLELSISNQQSLTTILSLIVGYFLVSFIAYSLTDYIAWKLRFARAYDEAKERMDILEKQRLNIAENHISIIYNALKPKTTMKFVRPASILRVILEFILPIALGMYSVHMLYLFAVI